jgi:hypothetical protein
MDRSLRGVDLLARQANEIFSDLGETAVALSVDGAVNKDSLLSQGRPSHFATWRYSFDSVMRDSGVHIAMPAGHMPPSMIATTLSHSARNVIAGSTRAARHAGNQQASIETAARSTTTPM